jgi:DNA-binding LacI/PurR family transcriptional regulator
MEIKDQIRQSGLKQWEIAEHIGISEFTFCRWMRRPEKLSADIKQKIETAIESLKKGGAV